MTKVLFNHKKATVVKGRYQGIGSGNTSSKIVGPRGRRVKISR